MRAPRWLRRDARPSINWAARFDRTVAALEPYLLQIRLEHRNSDA